VVACQQGLGGPASVPVEHGRSLRLARRPCVLQDVLIAPLELAAHTGTYVRTVWSTEHFQHIASSIHVFWVTLAVNSNNFCTQQQTVGVRNSYGAKSGCCEVIQSSWVSGPGRFGGSFRPYLQVSSSSRRILDSLTTRRARNIESHSPNDAAPHSTRLTAATAVWEFNP
jgi:hypothetical protein